MIRYWLACSLSGSDAVWSSRRRVRHITAPTRVPADGGHVLASARRSTTRVELGVALVIVVAAWPVPSRCRRRRRSASRWPAPAGSPSGARPAGPSITVAIARRAPGPRRSDSYVRPQRSLRATHRHGAKSQSMPVAGDLLGRDGRSRAPGRVAGRAQADVVREDRRADHVVVPVHRVDAVDQRDAQRRGQRRVLEAVVHVGPAAGLFGDGAEPPPDSSEPSRNGGDLGVSALTGRARPASSGRASRRGVIRDSRSATRARDRQPMVLVWKAPALRRASVMCRSVGIRRRQCDRRRERCGGADRHELRADPEHRPAP